MKPAVAALLVAGSLLTGFLAGRGSQGESDTSAADEAATGRSKARERERDGIRESHAPGSARAMFAEIRKSQPDKLSALMIRAIDCEDPIEKELLMAECLLHMDGSNWSELLAAFTDATGSRGKDQDGAWKHCLLKAGQVAGEEAMDHWRDKGLDKLRDEPWHTLYGWASADPAAARAWLERCEAGGEEISSALYVALIAGSGLRDSRDTMALLESLPDKHRVPAAGHLVWNLIARGGLDELKPWLDYAHSNSDDPQLAGLGNSLRGEIEKKFIWAATTSGSADVALRHLETLAHDPADLPGLAGRVLSGFNASKSSAGLDIVEGLKRNPRFADVTGMDQLAQRALAQAWSNDPASLDEWLQSRPDAALGESIRQFKEQQGIANP